MSASDSLAELPACVRDVVIGHWPETDVDGMRCNGDAYLVAAGDLTRSAVRYESEAARTEQAVQGATATGLTERHRRVAKAMRDQAAVCESLGKQCHDVADTTVQTQHLLIAMGIALAAQLAYDAVLFFQGGGAKALIDRLEAEQAMAAATARLAAGVGERAAAGAAQRAALHGAVHAAKIGLLTSAATSGGAQLWDLYSGVRDKFDTGAFLEMLLGGVVGGVAGAEIGRRVAPGVLRRFGGNAVSRTGRLAAHLGGTMLIGGAGGLGGGLAGAVPSVFLHMDQIHSFGDLFKMVRESAITGFGSGFVGAAGNALRVHAAGRDAFRSPSEATRLGLRHRDFALHINDLLRSGPPPRVETIERFSVEGKSAKVVERLVFHDGTEVIHKVVSDPQHAHAEFLSSLVGDAVGARVPAVHVVGDHVYMEAVPGAVAADTYPRNSFPSEVVNGPAGMRQGVMDVLIRLPDRNGDNWMVDPDGNVWGIDHSRAFEKFADEIYVVGPFAENFLRYGPAEEILWRDHGLTRPELQEIRQGLEQLGPLFRAAGHPDWHDGMMQRMTALEEHAAGGGTGGRGVVPPIQPPQPGAPHGVVGDGRAVSETPRQDGPAGGGDRGRNGNLGPRRGGEVDLAPRGRRDLPPPADGTGTPARQEKSASRQTVDERTPGEQQPPRRTPPADDSPPRPPADEPGSPVRKPGSDEVREGSTRPDEPTYDGPPTQPQPRLVPSERSADQNHYELAAAPPPAGFTQLYVHPDGGYVDVAFTGPDGTRIPQRLVPGQEYVLGRGTDALLENIAVDRVSRRHATIMVDELGHVMLRDDHSTNGTFVDGKQITGGRWVRIYDGQDVMLSRDLELGVSFQRQMAEVRLFGNDGPALKLYRGGRELEIGREMVHPEARRRDYISQRHAYISMDENGRVWIQDAGSTNGTKVNGERLGRGERRVLEPGDELFLGGYESRAEFVPTDVSGDVGPVRVRLGSGADVTQVRIAPGETVDVGTGADSPFAQQLRGVRGVGERHATLGLDHDGRLWIRDRPGSEGVWVNGDRIAPNQKVTLSEGDRVGLGPEYQGTAHLGMPTERPQLPPAELYFAPNRRQLPIRLGPGEEISVDVSLLNGHTMLGTTGRQVVVGRDVDGRVWVRDPHGDSWHGTKVNGELLPAGEKRYLNVGDEVVFSQVSAHFRLGEEPPLPLRLSDDENLPPLTLRRGEEVVIGRDRDSPMAEHLAGNKKVSNRHAVVYRDEYGDVWLRDENSARGTWVENIKLEPGVPMRLRAGDQIRLGDWVGAARFDDGYQAGAVRTLPVRMNSPHGDLSLDIPRGGEPQLLGRAGGVLPEGLPRIDEISRRHASIGVQPSGRVWIRDEGSTYGTYVNGARINVGEQFRLHSGDVVRLGDAYEFVVAYPPPDGGAFVNIMDRSPETNELLDQFGLVPSNIFRRVSEHMNEIPGGGIVIGNRPLLELPGTDSLVGTTPYGRKPGTSWNTVQGVYMGGPRRIVINSGGRSGSLDVVLHEFGHAVDAAYGTGGKWLSDSPRWRELHSAMLQTIGKKKNWNDYYDEPSEAFGEAWAAWRYGPKQLRKFTLGDRQLAQRLEDYFDSVFG
ncbi:FHA domain-containing protein [Nocardia blacklockiae]|uniref:FHA domain-containing protein n=1 Tax=Nocardia blacklockiae TaxID=480036 RepID=UPI00189424A9|nr:FHA domain-containing protein [Nocardia blacklockiae]MBF6171555.1 FHA domain-containing protein [Nocardia blacklockiae]